MLVQGHNMKGKGLVLSGDGYGDEQVIEEIQLDTSIIYHGNQARVRSFMHKLRSGVNVKMGARSDS